MLGKLPHHVRAAKPTGPHQGRKEILPIYDIPIFLAKKQQVILGLRVYALKYIQMSYSLNSVEWVIWGTTAEGYELGY